MRRLTLALLLSLLIHTLLLSLTFGGQGFGLPGFGFPWQERRIDAPDLRLLLVPAQVAAAERAGMSVKEPMSASIMQPVAGGPALTPSVSVAPTLRRTAEAIMPETKRTARAKPTAEAKPESDAATDGSPSNAPSRTEGSGDAAPTPIPEPGVIAMERSDEATLVVPGAPSRPTPVVAAAPSTASPETVIPAPRDAGDAAQERIDPAARERADELAERERSEREAQRQAVQLDAARIETAQREAERQQAQRVEAARVEAARVEAARVEAARVEAARVEAARVEAARVEAARAEAARVEAARAEAAKVEAAKVEAAREAKLRAIGRQLDEEADRREAASSTRRYWLFGRTDSNAELVLYAEAWSRKIQLNVTTFDMVREAAKQPHTDPIVTVAIRRDGSVESVTFVRSSGVAAIDEAIRRIVDSQKPYQVFPPGLAREFDVILIRRTWYFDTAIRIQ